MTILRSSILVIFGACFIIALLIDRDSLTVDLPELAPVVATPVADGRAWFCAGGSGPDGGAVVGLEIVNAGATTIEPEITVIGDGDGEPTTHRVVVEPFGRSAVALADLAERSDWVSAIVEVTASDVLVDQTHTGEHGTDRSSCVTGAASSVILPSGATRKLSHGEEMVLLLFAPYYEDAIADVTFDANVGVDSLEALVVPGRRVVAVDVTNEVTVASRVSTSVEVDSGLIVASRVQIRSGGEPWENLRGLSVMPGVANGAAVSVLPALQRDSDLLSVTNPNPTQRAEVDVEIIAEGIVMYPIELTIRAGRTVVVDLSSDERLSTLSDLSVVVRSLSGSSVAAMVERRVPSGGEDVPGVASMGALDAASTRWLAPVEGSGGSISIVNPSSTTTAGVTVGSAGKVDAHETFDLGPRQRRVIQGSRFGDGSQLDLERPIAVIEATSPVVVGREYAGATSRHLLAGIIAGPITALVDLY